MDNNTPQKDGRGGLLDWRYREIYGHERPTMPDNRLNEAEKQMLDDWLNTPTCRTKQEQEMHDNLVQTMIRIGGLNGQNRDK